MRGKKMSSYLLVSLAFVAIGLFSYYFYIASQKPCDGEGWPMPPPASLRFGPYYMVTDQGKLFVGQTYEHRNEGPWVGNLTLLFLDNRGATFLVRYPQGTGNDFKVMKCKKFYLRTPENAVGK